MPERTAAERAKELRAAVRRRYAAVAREPRGQFAYPIGLESLARLAYEPAWISSVPPQLAGRFVGVGNPFSVRVPRPGERVLDVGCGCGVDTVIAGCLVGPSGRSVGVDPSPEMLGWPRGAGAGADGCVPAFVVGSVEDLPFQDGTFDLVISNGALNLATDKERAFGEIARVLAPGGELAAADLVIRETIPQELLSSMDAWSS